MIRSQTCIVLALAFLFVSGISCARDDSRFEEEYAASLARVKDGADPLAALVALDQKYPDRLALKREIAAMLLSKGEIDAAESYLDSIERLTPSGDAKLGAAVQGVRARIALARGLWDEALSCAEKAIALDAEDAAGAWFTKGRALGALERKEDAARAFDTAFGKNEAGATPDDWMAYVAVLSESDPAKALVVLGKFDSGNPYQAGLGLIESALLEKTGDLEGAVYAVLRDIVYARSFGVIDDVVATERISLVEAALVSVDKEGSGAKGLVTARAFLRGDYKEAGTGLASYSGKRPFVEWMRMVTLFAAKKASNGELESYGALAGELSDLPEYWFHVTREFDEADRKSDMKMAAELCVDAAPEGPHAAYARAALARAVGLDGSDGKRMLTRREIETIGRRSIAGGGGEVLEPIYALLSLPDNEYTLFALGMVKELATRPFYRKVFEEKRKTASGRALERLNYVLSE